MRAPRLFAALAFAVTTALAGAAHAQTIAGAPPALRDPAAAGMCGVAEPVRVKDVPDGNQVQAGALVIQPTWDATITSRPGWQAVIQQAINEWQGTILDNGCSRNPLPIYFRAVPLGGFLGFTQSLVYLSNGCMFADTIGFDPAFTWFVDSTPANSSEFDGTSPAPAGFDLLTVARHEIGHAVGWGFQTPTNNLMSGSTFDANRLNVPVGGGTGMHTDSTWTHGGLMDPAVPQSVRRAIALYPDAAMIARAYGGNIPMTFVDPTVGGAGAGTAADPYQSFAIANSFAPAGWPLLLANGSVSHVVNGYLTGIARTWMAARGGASVVAP